MPPVKPGKESHTWLVRTTRPPSEIKSKSTQGTQTHEMISCPPCPSVDSLDEYLTGKAQSEQTEMLRQQHLFAFVQAGNNFRLIIPVRADLHRHTLGFAVAQNVDVLRRAIQLNGVRGHEQHIFFRLQDE